jgi:hypothetical protein
MSDHTANGVAPSRTRGPSFEYRIYFAVIFLISLPLCLVTCTLGLVRPENEEVGKNFVSRAWRRAAIITPMIFSA